MINVVRIDKVEDVFKIISSLDYNEKIDRYRSMTAFRGVNNARFTTQTSLKRNCKELSVQLEKPILRNFTKYAAIEDPTIESSIWRQMIVGQHHGLPTRLLDWTFSPLVAFHFAVTEENYDKMDKRDCLVWQIDMEELAELLPKKYKEEIDKYQSAVFSINQMTELTNDLDEYDRDMGDKAMVILEPPSIDPRIVNQYSFFSVVPSAMEDIEGFLDKYTHHTYKYIVSKDIRWELRDILDQLNISERIVYPGLDGLTKWIGRHYYVKGK